jgi:hypothetical protein
MNAARLVMVVSLVIFATVVVVAAADRDEDARTQADNQRQRDQHPYRNTDNGRRLPGVLSGVVDGLAAFLERQEQADSRCLLRCID